MWIRVQVRTGLKSIFSLQARGKGLSDIAIATVVALCKRLESSLLDCLAFLLVSYILELIVDRFITHARSRLVRIRM